MLSLVDTVEGFTLTTRVLTALRRPLSLGPF
jgi:hypothetical protein